MATAKINHFDQLRQHLQKNFSSLNEFLVEEYIEDQEVICGVYQTREEIITLPLTEIISQNDFFDYEAKYQRKSKEVTPARISVQLTEKIQQLTRKIFQKLRVGGSRTDFILKKGQIYFIETNTIPGLTQMNLVLQQLQTTDISVTHFTEIMLQEI